MQSSFVAVLSIVLISTSTFQVIPNSDIDLPTSNLIFQHTAGIKKTRVFNHHTYEVIDTSYFIIYHGSKTIEKIPNKGQQSIEQYYFSKTLSDDIYELSITNLEKVFPGNNHFHYTIEQAFKSDKDLMAYDIYLKEYKLKHLFSKSLVK